MNTKQALVALTLCLGLTAPAVHAASFYSATGSQTLGNAETWGGINSTDDSVILEVFFDFTPTADAASGALLLWEAGDTTGSSLTIKGNNLLLASRAGNDLEVVEAPHGLTSPEAGVQVVSVIDLDSNTKTLYVNGVEIGSGTQNQNDWAGGNPAGLGVSANLNEVGARPHSFYAGWGPISAYPGAANANMSFNAYLLADNDVNDILVGGNVIPSPTAAFAGLLGLAGLATRRRRG